MDCKLRGELALRPLSGRGQDDQMKEFWRKPGTVTRTLRVLNINLPLVLRELYTSLLSYFAKSHVTTAHPFPARILR